MFLQMHAQMYSVDSSHVTRRARWEAQMPRDDSISAPDASGWAAAAELAPMTDVWRQLLSDHVPNAHGRCQACTQGGTGIPTARWPCGPRRIAEAAAQCHAHRTA